MSDHNNTPVGASIYALISLCTWFASIQNIQIGVQIIGGLVAMISGVVSIYKNIKNKK